MSKSDGTSFLQVGALAEVFRVMSSAAQGQGAHVAGKKMKIRHSRITFYLVCLLLWLLRHPSSLQEYSLSGVPEHGHSTDPLTNSGCPGLAASFEEGPAPSTSSGQALSEAEEGLGINPCPSAMSPLFKLLVIHGPSEREQESLP